MAQIETWLNQDLLHPVKVRYLDGNLFSQDNAGNLIGVNLTRDGVDYSGGGSVSANVIRADGGTVAVTGALSGNVATVVLPQAAYLIPGVVSIVVKLTVSGEVTTIAAVVANVYMSSTDTAIDPGTIIPSIQTLISSIETAVASIPADYSSLWSSLAPAFSSSTAYTAGQYVTYDGGLYKFTADHAAGAWNSSHVASTNIGANLSELKSAFIIGNTSVKLKSGAISTDGLTPTIRTSRMYTVIPLCTQEIFSITPPSGYAIFSYFFDKSWELLGNLDWKTTLDYSQFPTGTKYMTFNVRDNSNQSGDISADVETVEFGFTVITNFENEINTTLTKCERTVSLVSGAYGVDGITPNDSRTDRIRTKSKIYVSGINRIILPAGFSAYTYCFNSSDTLLASVDWKNIIDISTLNASTSYVTLNIRDNNNQSANIAGSIAYVQLGIIFLTTAAKNLYDTFFNENPSVNDYAYSKIYATFTAGWETIACDLAKNRVVKFEYSNNTTSLLYRFDYDDGTTTAATLPESPVYIQLTDHCSGIKIGAVSNTPLTLSITSPGLLSSAFRSMSMAIVGTGGDFPTIQEAIDNTSDGDTILVLPGTYREQVSAWGKERHIVGADKSACILIDSKSDYDAPPLEIGSGSVINMTIVEDATDTSGTPQDKANLAYCIHIETPYSANHVLRIENCIMKNANRPCLGIGLRQDFELTIKNCEFYSGTHIAGDARGAVYFHTQNTASITGQKISLQNNKIVCSDTVAMTVMPLQNGVGSAEFINNMVYSEVNGKQNTAIWNGTNQNCFDSNFVLSPTSYGNNVAMLND